MSAQTTIEIERAKQNLTLEKVLEDAPNFVKFLEKRFGSKLTVGKFYSYKIGESIIQVIEIKEPKDILSSLYIGTYSKVTDKEGKIIEQTYKGFIKNKTYYEGVQLVYRNERREDSHKDVPFP